MLEPHPGLLGLSGSWRLCDWIDESSRGTSECGCVRYGHFTVVSRAGGEASCAGVVGHWVLSGIVFKTLRRTKKGDDYAGDIRIIGQIARLHRHCLGP